jgi:PAS domain S-box-containing protein
MHPWLSLGRKLQLLVSTLLFIVVVAVSWAAYREVKQVLVESAGTRLGAVTQELADMLAESAQRARRHAIEMASEPAVERCLADTTDTAACHGTRKLLDSALATRSRPVAVSIWRSRQQPFVVAGSLKVRTDSSWASAPAYSSGPLIGSDTTIYYGASAPVRDGKDTLGHVVLHWRVGSSGTAKQVADLIGPRSMVMLGNRRGTLWTDLSRQISPPREALQLEGASRFTTSWGEEAFGTARAIRQTPWVIVVHQPRADVVAPARRFLFGIGTFALAIILLGALCAWLLGRSVTTPLSELTHAAEDLARGDYSRRVALSREDEIGRLGVAFNAMAQQVGDAATRVLSSERHFRALIENASDMICLVGADGRFMYVSPAQERFIGYTPADMKGQLALDFIHPDDQSRCAALLGQALQSPRVAVTASFKHRHKNGNWRDLSAVITNLLDDPAVHAIVINSYDLTDQVALQAQLLQAQKMEAIGQLAGGVAHDFNNLLTVVSSYSAILLTDLPGDSPARDDVQEIATAADRAAALTRQLLAFSRQQVLQPQVFDLNVVVEGMRRMLGRVVREDVRLQTVLEPSLGAVHADPRQLEQVIVNLAVNARDAMPNGGTLTIETCNVDLDEEETRLHAGMKPGPYVTLSVSDTGLGMDAETQARIFEPFFTTKGPGEGTGLGLATVYGIVQQSGGHVWVYSEPGLGSTFKIYLPVSALSTPARSLRDSPPAVTRGSETVLLVEDEASVRAVARRILERAGYSVVEAKSSSEAVKLFSDHRASIDLLLTDMVMPEMSGRELAERLRAESPSLRAVFMSGYTEDAVLRQGGAGHGSNALFIQKPFTTRALTEKLREALDGVAHNA